MFPGFKPVYNDIRRSAAYRIIRPFTAHFIPTSILGAQPEAKTDNPAASLAQDPRFQSVFQDPEIQKAIAAQDYGKLMANPKIMGLTQELMSDPQAMKKLMAISGQAQGKN